MGTQSTWESQKGPCPCLNKRLISIASLFETTNLLNKQNGKGFRIKEGQEERLQRLRPLLPEADPGVQGGFSVSWTQTRTVSCPPVTLWPLSTLLASPFPTVRPKACSQRPPDQSTSHRWSCFSQKRWLEVLMMTTPSLRLSMPSKSTAKSTQTCSNTPL